MASPQVVAAISHAITATVLGLGALGVFALMVPESAGIVVPSEVVLLVAGAAVARGRMDPILAVLAATAGNITGSVLLYAAGAHSRRLGSGSKAARALARCDQLFARHGTRAVFVGRLLPLARSFVSLPAGRIGVPLGRFLALTAAGCLIWCAAFVAAGAALGESWEQAGTGVRDATLVGLAALAVVWLVRRWRRRQRWSIGT